jgi:glycosyltransferase involved in cell wall biosynthesis
MADRLTVIIPAFNESLTIGSVVRGMKLAFQDVGAEVVVVDDGSRDETALLAQQAGARIIRHERNRGYGSALKTAVRATDARFVLTVDGDGQHRVEDARRLWELRNDNDLVAGARARLVHSPLWRMPGKWFLNVMARYLARQPIPDLNCGLRLFRREVLLKYLHVCPSGFSFSTTTTLAFLSRGWRVEYVPVDVAPRVGRSTVTPRTGLETIVLLLRVIALFDPLRVFIPASALTATIGLLWGIPFAIAGRGVSVGAMLAIVTATLSFGLGLLCDQISQLRLERFETD